MRYIRNISISNKMLIPPLLMTVALGFMLLLSIFGLSSQRTAISRANDIALKRMTGLNEFIAASEQVQSDVFQVAILSFMKMPQKEIEPVHERLTQGLIEMDVLYGRILTQWRLDQREADILNQMKQPMARFTQEAKQAAGAVSEKPSIGVLLVRSAAVPFSDFRGLLVKFLNYQKEKIAQAEAASTKTADTIRSMLVVIALITTLIAVLITGQIGARFISRPVRRITSVMSRLAAGDLSTEIGELDRKDEIGSMAGAVEVFRQNAIEKQAAEKELRKERDRSQNYLDIAGVMLVAIDKNQEVILINKKGCEILGYEQPEIIGQNWFDHFLPAEDRDAVKGVFDQLISGDAAPVDYFENRILNQTGELRLVAWHNTILKDETNHIIGTLSSGEDITDRKNAQEQIKASLQEKEILLKEIHHRVKNNLQVISSLLRLQADAAGEYPHTDLFRESRNRIQSMALIHEALYRSGRLSQVDFAEYLRRVLDRLWRSYGVDRKEIVLTIDVEAVSLDLEEAIPCGLIINELISNSLKYAFPSGGKGEIRVHLHSVDEDELLLIVGDNGVGLPADIDFKNTDTLGLHLVTILIEDQLHGRIDLDREGGAAYRMWFKKKKDKVRI